MRNRWEKPELRQTSVNAECTAYSGSDSDGEHAILQQLTADPISACLLQGDSQPGDELVDLTDPHSD
jgi:hypothetical protein